MLAIDKQADLSQQEEKHITGHRRQPRPEQSLLANKEAKTCEPQLQLKIRKRQAPSDPIKRQKHAKGASKRMLRKRQHRKTSPPLNYCSLCLSHITLSIEDILVFLFDHLADLLLLEGEQVLAEDVFEDCDEFEQVVLVLEVMVGLVSVVFGIDGQ